MPRLKTTFELKLRQSKLLPVDCGQCEGIDPIKGVLVVGVTVQNNAFAVTLTYLRTIWVSTASPSTPNSFARSNAAKAWEEVTFGSRALLGSMDAVVQSAISPLVDSFLNDYLRDNQ